jgi:transcriptional regulator with XRE-family HTH domain
VTPRYLAGIERGERNLTLDSVDALADQLGVPAKALLIS